MDQALTTAVDADSAPPAVSWGHRLRLVLLGVLCGILAALAMVLFMLVGRTWLGISPPFEALPDRFAPTLSISTFFSLFGRFGGYNGLKRFGILSGLGGLFALGVIFGVLYALIAESAASRKMTWRNGVSPRAAQFIAAAAVVSGWGRSPSSGRSCGQTTAGCRPEWPRPPACSTSRWPTPCSPLSWC